MKTKRFDKKLVLNKKTIAHLGRGELNAVEGGIECLMTISYCPTYRTCPTDCKTCLQTGVPVCLACADPI